MNNSDKIIRIVFEQGQVQKRAEVLTEWDYGQVLEVHGLDIPNGVIEVDFSLSENDGAASTFLGTVENNVITVNIPDFMFQNENAYDLPQYEAYAFIYLSDGVSGKTIRKIIFPIQSRPSRTTDVPKDKKDEFLQEVRAIMQETKDIAQSVRDDADAGKFGGGTNITVDAELSEESKNAVENRVIAKEVNSLKEKDESLDKEVIALKERNAKLEETVEKLQIKTTTSPSPFHHITDSANMKVVDFGMEGKTEQETCNGNQLFELTNNYLWGYIARDRDTITDWNLNAVVYMPCNPNTTYTISGRKTFSGSTGVKNRVALCSSVPQLGSPVYSIKECSINEALTITTDENAKYLIIMAMTDGDSTIDNREEILKKTVEKLMVNKGSTALPYEPYIGGQPYPNPDYPQEIKNAGVYNEETGRYEIGCKAFGKNVLSTNPSDWINSNNTYYKQKILALPNTTNFTITVKTKDSTNYPIGNVGIGTWTGGAPMGWIGDEVTTLSMPKFNCVYLYIKNRPLEELLANYEIQVEWGSVSTESLPYTEQRFTLTSPVPLTKWDKLVKRDGVWGWSVNSMNRQVVGTYLNNALTYGWMSYVSGNEPEGCYTYQIALLDKLKGVDNVFCTSYKGGSTAYGGGAKLYTFSGIISGNRLFFNTYIPTVKEWIAHIDENPLDVWYQTTEEQSFHPLPDEEQILLNNLETYYGVTNLYNDQGCPMWLTYVNDTKLYVDQKLLEIQQAMI